MRHALALLLVTLPLMSCASGPEALRTASLSQAPGAPGYVVVGMAEQNYRFGLVYSTQSVGLTLTSLGHEPVTAVREACGTLSGFVSTKPCDISNLGAVVLRLPPGTWTVAGATLGYRTLDGDQILHGALPPASFQLHPGEVVDLGEYVFASNADNKQMPLARHFQDERLTRTTLAAYPGLQPAPIVYAGGPAVP
jgi:hypothetical protein